MSAINNEELVNRFRDFLEKSEQSREELPRKLDLFSFYSEITALKSEIKIESRLIKRGLDNFQETAGLIEQGNLMLHSLVQESKTKNQENEFNALRPILTGLIDLYDRVHASLQTLPETFRAGSRFWQRRRCDEEILDSIRAGQEMLLERIVDLLFDCGVRPMEVSGRTFDPHTMRAVGTDSFPELDDGVVSGELRTGFTVNDEIFRLADVRVNRRKTDSKPSVTKRLRNIFHKNKDKDKDNR